MPTQESVFEPRFSNEFAIFLDALSARQMYPVDAQAKSSRSQYIAGSSSMPSRKFLASEL